ncbi:MAG: DNA recombination protein RmuC [Bacteroidia bacterium]
MEIAYIIIGFVFGFVIAWLLAKAQNKKGIESQGPSIPLAELEKKYIKNDLYYELKQEHSGLQEETNRYQKLLAKSNAEKEAFAQQQESMKSELLQLRRQFNLEFEHIANQIIEEKSVAFKKENHEQLSNILKPLGQNIIDFKKKVEETYDKESKERFSLADKIKELTDLNKLMSEEAKNLTQALKGEAKTQGRWGEMILESILEKSGLRLGEEYFLEHQLTDDTGKALRSNLGEKKMRPDAVIKYPDNRSVIIDSKVSLNAFTRFLESDEKEVQQAELQQHVQAIKQHINSLSAKGYDDYNSALDFVMMFVPSEPAYMAAVKADADLWNFAYDKRILLISPTNLITSLKLIVDLWKREYQNQNAQAIAQRGAKLYDKFVGFVANLEKVGDQLQKAQNSYNDAHAQLTTGNDNLVRQATKLKELGVKNKKELPKSFND